MNQHHTTSPVAPRRRLGRSLLVIGTVATALAVVQPASAKGYPIQGGGLGAYQLVDDGANVAGIFTGKPFDGSYVGGFRADDGTLPAAGDCEFGTASLRVDGSRGRFVEMTAAGKVCGKWTDATYVVTHEFTGRYLVEASSNRRLVGGDGFMSQLIANNGNANVFVIATD